MNQIISIIIPCYCSEQYLRTTVQEILTAFSRQTFYLSQIILIDDGSPDNTYSVIQALCREHPEITGILLSTNHGQARARMAGLPYVKGDYTIFMDDDGQHPAEGIFSLTEKLQEGFDLVYARFPSQKESLFRRLASRATNVCMTAITKKPSNLKITSFFGISRFASDALLQYKSPYIFLGGFLFQITKRITTVEIQHRNRIHGKSTYTFQKLYSMWLDNMLAFPEVPARVSRKLGQLICLPAVLLFVLAIWKTSAVLAVSGLISLFFGILFFITGIFGEVLLRSFHIMQGVPPYTIRETTERDTP